MPNYIFRDGMIRYRRRYVGSVRPSTERPGVFVGRIGQHAATGATQWEAFVEVVARAAGFANRAAHVEHNRRIRAQNRARRAAARAARAAHAIGAGGPRAPSRFIFRARPAAPARPVREPTTAQSYEEAQRTGADSWID